jgi:hypothetical protein
MKYLCYKCDEILVKVILFIIYSECRQTVGYYINQIFMLFILTFLYLVLGVYNLNLASASLISDWSRPIQIGLGLIQIY